MIEVIYLDGPDWWNNLTRAVLPCPKCDGIKQTHRGRLDIFVVTYRATMVDTGLHPRVERFHVLSPSLLLSFDAEFLSGE